MTLDELIKHYGSDIMVAATLEFSHQSVKNWAAAGVIPYASQCKIQIDTNDKFMAEKPCKA